MNRIGVAAIAAMSTIAGTAALAAPAGGLAIGPAILERDARQGQVGEVRVINDSSHALAITASARPWVQASTGAVRPDAKRRLSQVRLSATSFTLAPGATRKVSARLLSRPASGSLYGVIEVVGTPTAKPTNGVVTRYRLLSALRLNPSRAQRRLRVNVGAAKLSGDAAVLSVRNAGNTAQPLTGSARIKGASGTLRSTIAAQRILPGKRVDLRLRRGRLQPGRYTATITLRQGGKQVASVTRSFSVR